MIKAAISPLAATFGWLCVETDRMIICAVIVMVAATFGWLCVETDNSVFNASKILAATFGWLCVETLVFSCQFRSVNRSHLRVAVC